MKNEKNELTIFLAGVAMLAVGLFILSQKVYVHSSFFSGFGLGGVRMTAGLIMVPFIIGIVWLFMSGGSLGSKILTYVSIAFIVISIILSTSMTLSYMTLFDWIVILVLIFGGAGFILRILLGYKKEEESGYKNRRNARKNKTDNSDKIEKKDTSIEEELEEIRKNM